MKVIAVYDKKAISYMPPMFAPNRVSAVRMFERSVNADPERSDLARFPADYNLQELGEFDEVTGTFKLHVNPIVLHEALEFVQE